VLQLGAEQARVRVERLVEVGDRNAQMVDARGGHRRDATES